LADADCFWESPRVFDGPGSHHDAIIRPRALISYFAGTGACSRRNQPEKKGPGTFLGDGEFLWMSRKSPSARITPRRVAIQARKKPDFSDVNSQSLQTSLDGPGARHRAGQKSFQDWKGCSRWCAVLETPLRSLGYYDLGSASLERERTGPGPRQAIGRKLFPRRRYQKYNTACAAPTSPRNNFFPGQISGTCSSSSKKSYSVRKNSSSSSRPAGGHTPRKSLGTHRPYKRP